MNKDKLNNIIKALEIQSNNKLADSIKSLELMKGQLATPEQVAEILMNNEAFLEMVKGEQGDTPSEEDIFPLVESCVEACMPVKGVDYFDGKDAEPIEPIEVAKLIMKDKKFIKLVKGNDGYTPIKGVDYFTETDIKDIENTVEENLLPKLDIKIEETIDEKIVESKPDLSEYLRGDQAESLVKMAVANGGTSILSEGNKVGTYHNVNFIGATVTNKAGRVDVEIGVTPANDQVKNSTNDTLRGYLSDKLTTTSPLTATTVNPGGNESLDIAIPVATSIADGYLSSTDWTTFNNKEEVLSFTSPLSRTGNTVTTSMATNKLIGRGTAGTGVFEEITLGTGLSFTGTTLNATGTIDGSGTTNELTYWVDTDTIGALSTATYPSLTELSYVKGVSSAIQTQIDSKLSDTGDTGTGAYDFGGATTFEIPNSAAPTLNTTGQIAVDTTVTDFTNGLLKYYSTAEYGVVAMPIAQFTTPTNGAVPTYNATNDQFEMAVPAGGGGGITVGTTTITSGTSTRIPFNDGGVYGEDSTFTWNKTSDYLTVNTAIFSRPSSGTVFIGSFPASIVSPNNGTALGLGAAASVTTSANFAAFGYNAANSITTQVSVVAFGSQAFLNACAIRGVAIGYNAQANNTGQEAIGIGSSSLLNATGADNSVAIGNNAGTGVSSGFWDVLIGGSSVGAALGASYGNVIIGRAAGQTAGGSFGANRNTIIGYAADADAGLTGVIAIGAGAVAKTSNTIVIGGTVSAPTRMYIGLGETSATPTAITISPTNGVGTNISGANIVIAGSQPTGSGTPGYIVFATSAAGASGTTLRSLTNRARITDATFESLTAGSWNMPINVGSASEATYGFNDGFSDFGMYLDTSGDDAVAFTALGTKQFQIDVNGNLRAFNLHDNATADGDATEQDIRSGTYTPTLTSVTNVSSSTARKCSWMRVGNVVTVSGQMEVTATSNNAQTTIGISLPIASNFGTAYECGGAANTMSNTVAGHGGAIYADATNNRAELDYFETHGATDVFAFSFTYEVI